MEIPIKLPWHQPNKIPKQQEKGKRNKPRNMISLEQINQEHFYHFPLKRKRNTSHLGNTPVKNRSLFQKFHPIECHVLGVIAHL